MSEGFLKPKKTKKPKKAPPPAPPIDRTQFVIPAAPIPNIPDLPGAVSLPERAQAMTDDMISSLRDVMNDPSQPGSARNQAALIIKEIGYGKSTGDAPVIADKKDKTDVTAKILAMLTDAQLEELRSIE